MEFRILGLVVERESQRPVSGLRVRAFDRDFLFSDLLGAATTDASGAFEIEYQGTDFQELFDRRPDLFLQIYGPKQPEAGKEDPIFTTGGAIRWDAGRLERYRVEIPRASLGSLAPVDDPISLLGDDGRTEAIFEVGDALQIRAEGLAANAAVGVRIVDADGLLVRDQVLKTHLNGVLDPTVIWPNLGVTGHDNPPYEFETFEDAERSLANREFRVEILEGKAVVREAPFRFADQSRRPRVYPVNAQGRFTTGFLLGTDDLRIEGRNLREGTRARALLVPRQRNWRVGDPLQPVRGVRNSPVVADFLLSEGNLSGVLWHRDEVVAGAYDLIVRPYVRGQMGVDDLFLRADDVVANRRVTTLVVRIDVFKHKAVWLGCVNTQEMAGSLVAGSPYFRFRNTFAKGEPIYASLDPAGLMNQQIGKKIAYYVVQHKTAAQWSASSALTDVTPGLGKLILMDDCINHNDVLVWPNPQAEGEYDVVVDFGNNPIDPATFVEDASFDAPLDMMDGYFAAGFRVVEDPAVSSVIPYVGSLTYAEPAVDIPTPDFWDGSAQYQDPLTGLQILPYPLDAIIRYPAEADGTTVSSVQASYPVVVCVHGQHSWTDPNHEGYIYLLEHLARNGFIAVSIDQHQMNRFGLLTDARARGILAHLDFLTQLNSNPSLYGGVLQGKMDLTSIGLMGHSRGGDAVVRTQIFNQAEGLGWGIQAICAISPTDFHGTHPDPAQQQKLTTTPYLMIYGANDGDVAGWPNFGGPVAGFTGTGFRTYDRSTSEKTALYVRKGTHNRFNSVWGTEGGVDLSTPSDILSSVLHETVAKGSMNAFFQQHLQGMTHRRVFLTGEAEPPATASVVIDLEYSHPDRRVLDDFEPAPGYNTGANSLNGSVTPTNLDTLDENLMHVLDPKSAHQTSGGKIEWSQASARYRSLIPDQNSQRDVTGFNAVTLRVAQHWEAQGQADPLEDFYVTLRSGDPGNPGTVKTRAIRAGSFVAIREPYYPKINSAHVNAYGQPARSVFTTLRIPLDAWTIKCMSAEILDLQNVFELELGFFAEPSGKIEVDSIAFSK